MAMGQVINSAKGIWVVGSNNLIGGTMAAARNIISANWTGVALRPRHSGTWCRVTSSARTRQAGMPSAPASSARAIILDGSNTTGNIIGGTTPASRNIISGNNGDGIRIGPARRTQRQLDRRQLHRHRRDRLRRSGNGSIGDQSDQGHRATPSPETSSRAASIPRKEPESGSARLRGASTTVIGNKVQGNLIGTDEEGTTALANRVGVMPHSGGSVTDNTIGGTTAAERNVISGNQGFGVGLWSSVNNRALGNFIGTDITGTQPAGQRRRRLASPTPPYGNTIGGTAPGEGNVIAYSTTYGGIWLDTVRRPPRSSRRRRLPRATRSMTTPAWASTSATTA